MVKMETFAFFAKNCKKHFQKVQKYGKNGNVCIFLLKNCKKKRFLNIYIGNVFNPIFGHFGQNLQNVFQMFFGCSVQALHILYQETEDMGLDSGAFSANQNCNVSEFLFSQMAKTCPSERAWISEKENRVST